MSLQWAPPGNATDLCYGVNELEKSRAPPNKTYMQASQLILIIAMSLLPINLFFFYYFRKEPRMRDRPLQSSAFGVLAGFTGALATAGKPYIIQNTICWFQLFLFIITMEIYGGWYHFRMLLLVNANRYARAKALVRIEDISDTQFREDLESTQKFFKLFLSLIRGRAYATAAVVHNISSPKKFALGVKDSTNDTSFGRAYQTNNQASISVDVNVIDEHNLTDAVAELNFIKFKIHKDPRFMLVFALVGSLPSLIGLVILIITVDPYRGGCLHCPLFIDGWIVLVIAAIWRGAYCVWLIPHMITTKDAYGVKTELSIGLTIVTIGAWTTWILLFIDPGQLQHNRIVNWDWIIMSSAIIHMFYGAAWQFILCIYEKRRSRRLLKNSSVSYEETMADEELRDAFFEFCVYSFVNDGFRFIREVETWKEFYQERSESARRKRAETILKTFIHVGAPLQINISHQYREQIEHEFVVGRNVAPDVFDEALLESNKLLALDTFPRFLESNEFKEVHERRIGLEVSTSVRGASKSQLGG